MAPSSSSSAGATSVQVAVRIRPTTAQDASSIPQRFQRPVIHAAASNQVSVDATHGPPGQGATTAVTAAPAKKQSFNFDQVHDPSSTQYSIFTSTAQPLVTRFLEGFNCTILAYGQTSSGKTHTMTGIDLDGDPLDSTNSMGIIPRSVANIFARAKELRNERAGTWQFQIKGSFIELYNEDLLDLLVDDASGARRDVQIREDKDGHIIWGGLREVSVQTPQEVMSLIRQGTSMRTTHGTDMNAQSSRSHAIFSLTLIQKKFSGSGAPPRSHSPLPPNSRSPSRLARPGSMYAAPGTRIGSPTVGRPPTPSFAAAMGRGAGGLRPNSALGHSSGGADEDGPGEWTTISSKFHFVDLAGSERLKRTAAQGDRAKEGISINSGLLALGNVISALGDPGKSRSTHVPYRDSKLTRLLQDSLGGNAHTLMIACVSAAEWNIAETVNTLKYANRARNIKNRAEIKEKEEGWEDVDWLQSMVTKLRKELKTIKDGGTVGNGTASAVSTAASSEHLGESSQKVLQQMVELQGNYEDLRSRFTERTEELTRLRRDLEDRRSSISGAVGGSRKYEEIVGPVIEEYEKTIGAMEAELSVNRAALRHTNDMYNEKDEELNQLHIRHAATEAYVEELRLRVAKLSERESATESYVRDLEAKLKTVDENTENSNSSVADLKKEIARFKDVESHSAQHIAELEARLAKSDESVLSLRASVERLEENLTSRQVQVEELQKRLENLNKDSEAWRASLEEREQRVSELEEKLLEWEAKKQQAAEDRERLGHLVDGVAKARQSLDLEVAKRQKEVEEALRAVADAAPAHEAPADNESELQAQYITLQQTHTATLSDLSSVTNKYRDALREISDLAAQIAEAKLQSSTPEPTFDPILETPTATAPQYDTASLGRRRGMQRRPTAETLVDGGSPAGRKLFFRHAASAESLHARSLSQSQSLSQELSSARTPKLSLTAGGTNGHIITGSPKTPGHGHKLSLLLPPTPILSSVSPITPSDTRSVQSLEKEIMRLQEVLKERESEIGSLETSLKELKAAPPAPAPAPARIAMTNGKDVDGDSDESQELSVNEHDGENSGKLSPTTMKKFAKLRRSMIISQPPNFETGVPAAESDSLTRLDELMRSMAQKESQHTEQVGELSKELTKLRRQHDDLIVLSRDQTINMSTELEGLRSQLRDADGHQAELSTQLSTLQTREAELAKVLQEAAAAHAAAVVTLRAEHETALSSQSEDAAARLSKAIEEHQAAKASHEALLAAKQTEVDAIVQRIAADHQDTLSRLHKEINEAEGKLAATKDEHQNLIKEMQSTHAAQLKNVQESHTAEIEKLKAQHETTLAGSSSSHKELLAIKAKELSDALEGLKAEHQTALAQIQEQHSVATRSSQEQSSSSLESLRKQHEESVTAARSAHEAELSRKQSAADAALAQLREQHAAALKKLITEHEDVTTRKESEVALQLARLKEDHIGEMKQADLARAGSLSESQSAQAATMNELQQQHATTLERREKAFAQDLENAKAEHAKVIASKEEEFSELVENLQNTFEEQSAEEQEKFIAQLKDVDAAHAAEISRLSETHAADAEKAQAAFAEELKKVSTEHAHALAEKDKEFERVLAAHSSEHEEALAQAVAASSKLTEELEALEKVVAQTKTEYVVFKTEHETTVESLRAEHSKTQENLSSFKQERDREHSRLAETLAKSEAALELLKTTSQSELASSLQSAKQEQTTALENLSKEHTSALERLAREHQEKLAVATASWEAERTALQKASTEDMLKLKSEHQAAMTEAQKQIVDLQEQHQHDLEESRLETDMLLSEEREKQVQALEELDQLHETERETLRKDRELLAKELATVKTFTEGSSQEVESKLNQLQQDHENALNEKLVVIARLEQEITSVMKERREYSQEVDRLRTEAERTRTTEGQSVDSRRESLMQELDRHRSVIGDLRVDLQKTKDAMDTLQAERARQDAAMRDLQAQMSSAPTARNSPVSDLSEQAVRRANGVPPSKPPPAGVPPSVPMGISKEQSQGSISSRSMTTMSTSLHSHTDSVGNPSTPSTSVLAHSLDTKLSQQFEDQSKQIEEKETMIKTLTKQLAHCEGDLQAHMELVGTLENSLNDSERNLRKARQQATELARDRDAATRQLETTRTELQDAKREVVSVRMSVVEEKQSLEQRLDEERKAKERARAQLDLRMEEMQKRKSKFACL